MVYGEARFAALAIDFGGRGEKDRSAGGGGGGNQQNNTQGGGNDPLSQMGESIGNIFGQ